MLEQLKVGSDTRLSNGLFGSYFNTSTLASLHQLTHFGTEHAIMYCNRNNTKVQQLQDVIKLKGDETEELENKYKKVIGDLKKLEEDKNLEIQKLKEEMDKNKEEAGKQIKTKEEEVETLKGKLEAIVTEVKKYEATLNKKECDIQKMQADIDIKKKEIQNQMEQSAENKKLQDKLIQLQSER